MRKVFVALVLLCAVPWQGSACPHAEYIVPCSCRPAVYGQHVVCTGVNSVPQLRNIFNVLKSYKIGTLLMHTMNPDQPLPHDIFSGMNILLLRFVQSKVKFGSDGPALQGLENTLSNLDISRSTLDAVDIKMAPLIALQELSVAQMEIPQIRAQWLGHDLVNLRTLRLEDADIKGVDNGAMSKLVRLEHLSLADNRLDVVNRKVLPDPASTLKSIDLSDNELSSLPEDFFTNMPALTAVVLSGNDIQTLPEDTWIPVWLRLNKLVLYDNPLLCDNSLNWMRRSTPEQLDGRCVLPKEWEGQALSKFLKNTALTSARRRRRRNALRG